MFTTDELIARIREINEFIVNNDLSKKQLEFYLNKVNKLKKGFSQFEIDYYDLDIPLYVLE